MNFDFFQNVYDPRLFKTGLILFITILAIIIFNNLIAIFFRSFRKRESLAIYEHRLRTLKGTTQSIVSLIIFLTSLLFILKNYGIDITPLLTGAGLFGLAVSFGAQTFIKDLIAGFFIILEDQYNIGDEVEINNHKGRVFRINLRTTILKDKNENLIYFPNSEINKVLVFKNKTT